MKILFGGPVTTFSILFTTIGDFCDLAMQTLFRTQRDIIIFGQNLKVLTIVVRTTVEVYTFLSIAAFSIQGLGGAL